jgi:hypothetical protein
MGLGLGFQALAFLAAASSAAFFSASSINLFL